MKNITFGYICIENKLSFNCVFNCTIQSSESHEFLETYLLQCTLLTTSIMRIILIEQVLLMFCKQTSFIKIVSKTYIKSFKHNSFQAISTIK